MVIEILFSLPFDDTFSRLLEEMQIDPEPEIRQTILQSFASRTTAYNFSPAVATAIASRITDTSVSVRMEAARLLRNMKFDQIAPNVIRRISFFAVSDINSVKSLFVESLCQMLERRGEINMKKFVKILSPALYKEKCQSLIYSVLDFLQSSQESSQQSQEQKAVFHIPHRSLNDDAESFILMSICIRDKDLYESSLGLPEARSTFRSANCNFGMIADTIKKGISEKISLFTLENCLELLLASPPLNEEERNMIYNLSLSLLNSSFLNTELVGMVTKLFYMVTSDPQEFREKIFEVVADLCEPLEDKDNESVFISIYFSLLNFYIFIFILIYFLNSFFILKNNIYISLRFILFFTM